MRFGVLGPLQVWDANRPVTVGPPKQRAVLGILISERGRVVSTDRMIELVWGDAAPADSLGALRYHVSKLRDVLQPGRGRAEEGVVATRAGGYVLDVRAEQVDAERFESLVVEARTATDPAGTLKMIEEALALWRGAAYADFAFEEFAQPEIRRLEELRLIAEEARAGALLELGRTHDAVTALTPLAEEHPLREGLWGLLMLALYRAGRQADALRAYQQIRSRLGEELGIEPSPEIQRLEEHILLQDSALDRPLVTPTNLPATLSSFVGRRADVDQLTGLLRAYRLVTLTGPGGAGKSRLALETAHRVLDRYPDGVWLVELASVIDPSFVPHAVLSAAGMTGPAARAAPVDRLVEALARRTVLLVVDNCEHLVDPVAHLATALLARLPLLRILATSREPLRVAGEALLPVEGLPYPDRDLPIEEIGACPAVELFVQRAAAVAPSFRLTARNCLDIARLCARLDGLPLALELAAAATRALSPAQLLDWLDTHRALPTTALRTAPPRHQSIQAAIGTSYDTLTGDEQILFSRLAVFSGGFTLDAVEQVCAGDPIGPGSAPALLASLVDKSLVATAAASGRAIRYRLLESLRLYAAERLDSAGEAPLLRERHAAYYRQWAAVHGGPMAWPQHYAEVEQWQAEVNNIRAALDWSFVTGHADTALHIAGNTRNFWQVTGAFEEGLGWLERALEASEPLAGLPAIIALRGAGALADALGRFDEAQVHNMRAIDLAGRMPDVEARLQLVSVLGNLGNTRMKLGDYDGAFALFEECARLGTETDHPHLATAFGNLAWTSLCRDDPVSARAYYMTAPAGRTTYGQHDALGLAILDWMSGEQASATSRLNAVLATGKGLEADDMADAHVVAALLARDQARPDVALDELRRGLPYVRAHGGGNLSIPDMLAWWLRIAATVHADFRHFELAARLAGAATAAQARSPGAAPGWMVRDFDRHLDQVRAQMEPQDFDLGFAKGAGLTTDEACLEALRPVA